MKKSLSVFSLLVLLLTVVSTSAFAAQKIRFGVPPWPGVTVKTEVVTQILETLGYETEQREVSPPIIYKGMTSDDIDAYVAGWVPQQNTMIDPLLEKKQIVIAGTNLSDAKISFCVPRYVWEAGVRSLGDLDANAERFHRKIYNIEVGSGMHTEMSAAMEKDVAGLGDWEQVSSTTPMMLSQVGDLMKGKEWVTFACWKPHWMNTVYDMEYLEGVPGLERVVSDSKVYSVVSLDFEEKFPQAFRFLQQFVLNSQIQSEWIYSFGYENIEADVVARDWIAKNLDIVAVWLDGVKTLGGKPAIDAVRAKFE